MAISCIGSYLSQMMWMGFAQIGLILKPVIMGMNYTDNTDVLYVYNTTYYVLWKMTFLFSNDLGLKFSYSSATYRARLPLGRGPATTAAAAAVNGRSWRHAGAPSPSLRLAVPRGRRPGRNEDRVCGGGGWRHRQQSYSLAPASHSA